MAPHSLSYHQKQPELTTKGHRILLTNKSMQCPFVHSKRVSRVDLSCVIGTAMVDPLTVPMTESETNCLVQIFSQKVSGEVYSLSPAYFEDLHHIPIV